MSGGHRAARRTRPDLARSSEAARRSDASLTSTSVSISPCATKNGGASVPSYARTRSSVCVEAPVGAGEANGAGNRGVRTLEAGLERRPVRRERGHRGARRVGAVAVEVEQIPPARFAVADVGYPLDIVARDGKRREEDTRNRDAAAKPSGHPSVDAGPPADAEAFA
jgi:hypothetical protein